MMQYLQRKCKPFIYFPLNFLTCIDKNTLLDVLTWLIAVLAAGRITIMVIRGGRLGSRPWTTGENEREPCRNIPRNFFPLFSEQLKKKVLQ
jgi:hypothetical protein